eukprot:comp24857_c0_seq1/m.46897 comp24857_c0_seq1/g.46897  ORF comp24857_c0_seq1/g.46897 comp24857_c0_seq1/m.46897 type:complete len:390 (-) comp24857_c0_seq1:151-1320(-)
MRVVNEKTSLILTPVEDKAAPEGSQVYSVKLVTPLEAGASTKLLVRTVVTHGMTAYPSEIAQGDNQFMVYTGNNYYFSPYTVTKQKTVLKVPEKYESHETDAGPGQIKGSELTLGPYENKAPYSTGHLKAHYRHNVPHVTTYEMIREIVVSHWSRIVVNEIVRVRHDGAKLKGHFSRIDLMTNPNPPAMVKGWTTKLPVGAADVDYRDDVGNVTTSNLRLTGRGVEVQLRPRFPLFGGWNSDYMLNYTLPANKYLRFSGKHYSLKMPFVSDVMDNVVIDHLTVKISVPEGATNLVFKYKYPVEDETRGVKTTYLDTAGRPTIIVTKSNVLGEHSADFEVTYDFETSAFLHEPALLIGFYFVFFLGAIVYNRLDLAIYKDNQNGDAKKTN